MHLVGFVAKLTVVVFDVHTIMVQLEVLLMTSCLDHRVSNKSNIIPFAQIFPVVLTNLVSNIALGL